MGLQNISGSRKRDQMIKWKEGQDLVTVYVNDQHEGKFYTKLVAFVFIIFFGGGFLGLTLLLATTIKQFFEDVNGSNFLILFWILIFWLVMYYFLSSLWMTIRRYGTIKGYYISAADFVKIYAYSNKIEEDRIPLERVVTVEVQYKPDTRIHSLMVIISADQMKQKVGVRKVLDFSVSIQAERYDYFPKYRELEKPFIWGEEITSSKTTPISEMLELSKTIRELLAEKLGIRSDFFYPVLHCIKCQHLNTIGSSMCSQCNTKLKDEIPSLPIFK